MSKKQKMTAVVISQEKIAEDIYSMWLKAEPVAAEAVPGQFISMYTNDGAKLLPRPISLCEIDKEKGALRVVYRVTGEKTGTKQFSQMKAGDSLEVMGPLGNGFDLETGKEKKALLFGGGIGVPPMQDIIKELLQPGRDPRDELPPPMLRTDVLDMKDLKQGMELQGTVRNVIDFGAFVDIGVHQDGLVHISQITDRFIKHPLEAVSVGDVVDVKVMSVDLQKKRIQLTMRGIQ